VAGLAINTKVPSTVIEHGRRRAGVEFAKGCEGYGASGAGGLHPSLGVASDAEAVPAPEYGLHDLRIGLICLDLAAQVLYM
jgi:hypothetical protein